MYHVQLCENESRQYEVFQLVMDWESLKMGPETALTPKEREASSHKTDEDIDDL